LTLTSKYNILHTN